MKVAINVTREPLAGITATNLSLFNHLHESDTSFAGVEINAFRTFTAPIVYRHLSPGWFNHQIISICDIPLNKIVKKSHSLKDVEKHFSHIIKIVRDILKKEQPDTVLINGSYYIPWIISIAAKKENIPIVLWYAGILTKEVSHMAPHFRKIYLSMERSIVNRANHIIFPSDICRDTVYNEVCRSNSVKNGTVISNPISPIFTRHDQPELPVQNRIAFVGRYTPIKNIEEFCSLHKKLLKIGWKHEATIVSNIGKKELRKIPKTIKVMPSMSPAEIKIFYATQGLIISPSHFETFGNVPIEAVCIGIPALVSKDMGCSEVLIESGLERMVIDFSNTEAVTERIMELCGQHVLPRQINNLKKRVDAKYVANEIMSVIHNHTLPYGRKTKKRKV